MLNLIENNTAPLFLQMKEKIVEEIKQAGLKPGDKIPSENQFCFASEVSIRTIRRALAELEKDGVIVRRQGKGSFLRDINAANKPVSAGVIGILFSDMQYLSHPVFSSILQAIEKHVHDHGYSFHLYSTGDRLKTAHNRPMETIVPLQEVKGLIATSALSQEDILTLRRSKVAMVAFNEYRDMQLNSIVFDYYSAARMGVEYLWRHGYENIAFICRRFSEAFSSVIFNNDIFLKGIKEIYSENGRTLDESMIFQSNAEREDGRNITGRLLESNNRPDAIFTIDDRLAQGVLDAAEDYSLKIPEDCELLTCSGGITPKGIDYIEIPVAEWGKTAVEMLMKSIDGDGSVKKSKILAPQLTVSKI